MSTTRGQHLIGQVIGTYLLERILGYGGSSTVFLAQNRLTSEKVAIKVFQPRSTMDKQAQKSFYQRFLREAEATSELDHPNILTIYSYGQHNGLPYIVMPYMSGGTLSEYVTRHGPLPLGLAVYYLEQIASALDYAHENGRVHCDVKPHNILLESEDHIVLSDFGIVQFIEPNSHHMEHAAKSPEMLMGTPDYISPEQATGKPVDGRSDVYSLAVTLFFLLVGRPPFQADSSLAIALMHAYEPPPQLSAFRDDITPQVDRVIEKALAKEPEDRYQTAGLFSTEFAEAVANIEHYVPTDSEARMQVMASSSVPKRAKASIKNSSYTGPSSKGRATLWKFALPVILLLAAIIGSTLSVFFIGKFTHTNHSSTPTASPTQTDYLADSDAWPVAQGRYFFQDSQYYIKNSSADVATSFYNAENNRFSNFRLTVTVTEVSGTFDSADFYGIIFRSATSQNRYYFFEIDTCCSGGLYELLYYNGQSKQKLPWTTLADGQINASASSTLGKTNTITVVAQGSTFQFFVNGKSVGKPITDHSGDAFPSGEIGLGVEEPNTQVAFSHLYINRL